MSYRHLEPMFLGATFKDFVLREQKGKLLTRKDADLTMPLTDEINLAIPIIAANMDTVTGVRMHKAINLEGGFAFLPRNCPIDVEVEKVQRVKQFQSYIIENPLVLPKSATIGQAKGEIRKKGISGILVEESRGSGILAGILSRRDIPLGEGEDGKPIANYMTESTFEDKIITRGPDVSMEEAEKVMFECRFEKLPLIDKNRKIKGLITMRDLKLAKQKPRSTLDRKGRLLVGATIGATQDYMERAEAVISAGADVILIDIAHGFSIVMEKAVKAFRSKYKNTPLVCGNVSTRQGARFLLEIGADAIKVGIGPGKGCLTRKEVRYGLPQLQAIREAYLEVDGKIPIIADGGINDDGDIVMAILGGGGSAVMLGSKLAGTDEAPGRVEPDPVTKQPMKMYRGMTSPQAVLDGAPGEDIEDVLEDSQAPEGRAVAVPYKGSVVKVLKEIKGHLQSAVSYSGEKTLLEARRKVSYLPEKYLVRLSSTAQKESFDR